MTTRIPRRMTALLLAGCLSPLMASAQAIQIQRKTFIDAPALPIAPPPKPAPAVALGSAALQALDRFVSPVATPLAAEPGVPGFSVAAAASFEIEKGKSVEVQLRAYGKRAGWNLIWQAPEYALDQNMTIPGDFEAAVLSFLNGANEAGTRLRAVFYRGNKTVRVTEF